MFGTTFRCVLSSDSGVVIVRPSLLGLRLGPNIGRLSAGVEGTVGRVDAFSAADTLFAGTGGGGIFVVSVLVGRESMFCVALMPTVLIARPLRLRFLIEGVSTTRPPFAGEDVTDGGFESMSTELGRGVVLLEKLRGDCASSDTGESGEELGEAPAADELMVETVLVGEGAVESVRWVVLEPRRKVWGCSVLAE